MGEMNSSQHVLPADWPAPENIRACTTLRTGGVSFNTFESWNLADHVADDADSVFKNRTILVDRLNIPTSPIWLQQVHGVNIFQVEPGVTKDLPTADGSYTDQKDLVCCVLTADCLPVLITNIQGSEVAAIHAGWRGLAKGVVEVALKQFNSKREDLLVWLGPAIGPEVFEVGEEVRSAFLCHDPDAHKAFMRSKNDTLLANIYQLARQRLQIAGVTRVFGGDYCTFTEDDKFFSYRRHAITGRMASLIWMQS